jgi:hypothetical protein
MELFVATSAETLCMAYLQPLLDDSGGPNVQVHAVGSHSPHDKWRGTERMSTLRSIAHDHLPVMLHCPIDRRSLQALKTACLLGTDIGTLA